MCFKENIKFELVLVVFYLYFTCIS